jgi:uncharacterized Ntn-hydrolase superfamily protein
VTFSLLIRDPDTSALGGAVVTAGPCVGGYVLHGASGVGFVLTQGYSTNVFYGQDGLSALAEGNSADAVCRMLVSGDPGQARRQLAVMDWHGRTGVHSGSDNDAWCGHIVRRNLVATGNRLAEPGVLEAMVDAAEGSGDLHERLMKALRAGLEKGGDVLGVGSAALKVCYANAPPLDLRADHDQRPIEQLETLRDACLERSYLDFLARVPRLTDRGRS